VLSAAGPSVLKKKSRPMQPHVVGSKVKRQTTSGSLVKPAKKTPCKATILRSLLISVHVFLFVEDFLNVNLKTFLIKLNCDLFTIVN